MITKITIIILVFLILYLISRRYLIEKYNNYENNKFFKQVKSYYINLDHKTQRRKHAEKSFKKQKLNVERVSAINGRQLNLDDPNYQKYLGYTKDWYKQDIRRQGHFGLFLTMLKIYDMGINGDSEYLIIFEDDVEFLTHNFKELVTKTVQNAPDDWDIILFGYNINDDDTYQNINLKLSNGLINITFFQGLHAHIIKKSSLQKIKQETEKHRWLHDWSIAFGAEKGIIKIYGTFLPIVCAPGMQQIKTNHLDYKYDCKIDLGGVMDP